MKETTGNLIDLAAGGRFDVIVHGCNCFGNMGGGIAREISRRYPAALEADRATPRGDRGKLGTTSTAAADGFTIVNAYTQYDTTGPQPRVDYDAVGRAFAEVKQRFGGQRIGYPLIGCGLAGGDWAVVGEIIDRELDGEDHTLVRLG